MNEINLKANTFLSALSFIFYSLWIKFTSQERDESGILKIRKSKDIQLDREEDSGALTSPET